jgi:hypothetical protein
MYAPFSDYSFLTSADLSPWTGIYNIRSNSKIFSVKFFAEIYVLGVKVPFPSMKEKVYNVQFINIKKESL